MKTARDLIAAEAAIPDPPPAATHVVSWEPYGDSRSQWALGALDGSPDDEPALFDGAAGEHPGELLERVVAVLGYPVWLSRIECEAEHAYWVTPAGGGR
jgi:hypothetical protein